MSRDEEVAARGRVLTDFMETRQRHAALEHEAKDLGEQLLAVAQSLMYGKRLPEVDLDQVADAGRIRQLLAELDTAHSRLTNLRLQLRALGLNDME
jgi:hypothetical protein